GSAIPAIYLMATLPADGSPWLALLAIAGAIVLLGGAFALGLAGGSPPAPQAAPDDRRTALVELAAAKAENAELTAALEVRAAGRPGGRGGRRSRQVAVPRPHEP